MANLIAGGFASQLAAFAEKTKLGIDTVVRKVAIDITSALLMRAPVDTGRFRANWALGIGSPNTSTSETLDPSGSATLGQITTQISTVKAGGQIFITNSLPYALALERGHSKQAPNGMVALTALEFEQYMKKAIAS